MKKNRSGKSRILTSRDYQKIVKAIVSPRYRLIFQIATYTGERWGAIVKLRLDDIYSDPYKKTLREFITFHKNTRKASPNGARETRQVKIHPELETLLQAYRLEGGELQSGYLFPSQQTGLPITLRTADKYLREALTRCGLDEKGISTHSTRRTFITRLHETGASLAEIKKVTGHKSIKTLSEYIDVSEERTSALVRNFSLA